MEQVPLDGTRTLVYAAKNYKPRQDVVAITYDMMGNEKAAVLMLEAGSTGLYHLLWSPRTMNLESGEVYGVVFMENGVKTDFMTVQVKGI